MEKVKITRFMPSIKQYKDMVINEVTYFEQHNNSRFTVTSRNIPKWGTWVNFFRNSARKIFQTTFSVDCNTSNLIASLKAFMDVYPSIEVIFRCRGSVPYIYKWSREEEAILPKHYKDRCIEYMIKEQQPVHWRPIQSRYRVDEDSGERIPVVNAPIPVVFPKECNLGLWGGEGIIFGYYKKNLPKKKHKLPTLPRIWRPYLKHRVLYSEILDRWMSIDVTERAMFLIDEAFGLDFYILKTHEVDLCSKLGMSLKREMLLALANKSLYPNDPVKRDKIHEKYKEFVIPAEEAEWIGLMVDEAVEKATKLHEERIHPKPLKDQFLVELCQKLHLNTETKQVTR